VFLVAHRFDDVDGHFELVCVGLARDELDRLGTNPHDKIGRLSEVHTHVVADGYSKTSTSRSPSSVTSKKFIEGSPRKLATNWLAGSW